MIILQYAGITNVDRFVIILTARIIIYRYVYGRSTGLLLFWISIKKK